MRKLALDDEILLQIEKPARYIGNEINSVMKDKDKVDIRFCMCFPDVYEITHYSTIYCTHLTEIPQYIACQNAQKYQKLCR